KNSKLARQLEVPATTLQERLRRLEAQGVIKRYHAIVDMEKIGFGVQAFVSVSLREHESDVINAFEAGIRSIPNVRFCYHVTGRYDYALLIAAEDLKKLGDLIKKEIASIPGIAKVETFIALSSVKEDNGWHLPE
ncbi:MAG: Lrp/AsnC family transcriptional regulator, partial [Deltaproteobacteria bacterium]|nr:Lrp/AsnC family transcriptional regulator [Deltaproteobacteria bacterium]